MKTFLLTLLAIASFGAARAIGVDTSQKTNWKVVARPAGAGMYNLAFEVDLGFGWYTWSLHPGIDKSFVAPVFSIDPATATVTGPPAEQGITSEVQLPGKEGYARIYSSEAMFVQPVKGVKGRTVKGSYRFQLCNSKGCLPPQTVPFAVKLP